ADVDGLFIGLPDDYLSGLSFTEYLGIAPRLTDNNRTGGSSFLTHAIHAALALEAGLCDVALIAYGSNQRSAAGKLVSSLRPSPPACARPSRRPVRGASGRGARATAARARSPNERWRLRPPVAASSPAAVFPACQLRSASGLRVPWRLPD